jgi:hypothetical protein
MFREVREDTKITNQQRLRELRIFASFAIARWHVVSAFSALAGPHPRSLSRGDFAPRSGRSRYFPS